MISLKAVNIVASLRLLKLDERSQEVLGMKEQNGLSMRAEPGDAVAQHARTRSLQTVARSDDIVHLVADMVHAARWIFFQKGGNRRGIAERLQQLDPGVSKIDEYDGYAMFGQSLRIS